MDTPYVSDASAAKAAEFESRFLALPQNLGVLFIGVEAVPIIGGESNTFNVYLGISRTFPVQTGSAIIQQVLRNEISQGLTFQRSVFRGQKTG